MAERPWDRRGRRVEGSWGRSEDVDSLLLPSSSEEANFSAVCGRISEQCLSALLSLPPEKQDLEKFQVKNQPSNSTVGYSKEEKNKNQCEPGFRF